MRTFAAFILCQTARNAVCATTRDDGRIGLPGGKVDGDESPVQAAIREAREEGWAVDGVDSTPIHRAIVDGKPVVWFRATSAARLADYKEKARGIRPVIVTVDTIRRSGFGNDALPFA